MISPRDFVDRWAQSGLREQQAAQSHFNELCELVGHKTPVQMDPKGEFFTFEENVTKATGGKGRADVWYRGHFAWEYKGKHKSLDLAYAQLLLYRGALGNPPLLVVCDFSEYRIYPQWPDISGTPIVFKNEDLLNGESLRFIRWLLESPQEFLYYIQRELKEREQITLNLAYQFAHLADLMRRHRGADENLMWEPRRIARFLTKIVFVLFVEDIGLLPRPFDQKVFRYLVSSAKDVNGLPSQLVNEMSHLFYAMDNENSAYAMRPVPYFNGGIFSNSSPDVNDQYEVLDVTQIPGALDLLEQVSEAEWQRVNPTIFGTLFEGALDPARRAQLGAHYTSEEDIRLVIDPVLMRPLNQEWERVYAEAVPLMKIFRESESTLAREEARPRLTALHDGMMNRLENTRVLDPACGSGNFLYMSLRALKDLEGRVRKFFEPLNLPFRDVVTPRQLYGIEKDEFAANLARVVVWIGYLQWRWEEEFQSLNPVLKATSRPHPRQLPHPILRDKNHPDEPDRIICDDAILRYDADGKPYEPAWPEVDVIMGNPPFLGSQRMRGELGAAYADQLRSLYNDRVVGGADLVTFWFEKARTHIELKRAKTAGLLATNSIRGGANRLVLQRIMKSADIFAAWSDREWVLDGAAVRISVVAFTSEPNTERHLNGLPVAVINADLTSTVDLVNAGRLVENVGVAFQGPVKVGAFDIPDSLAEVMIKSDPSNRDVIKPYLNGDDIVKRSRNYWLIDFGFRSEHEARAYNSPFKYVEEFVKPQRLTNNDRQRKEYWWRLGRSGGEYRSVVKGLRRQIFTPRVAKHRIFVFVDNQFMPSDAVVVIAREDDYFFGVLHSYLHEKWALRLGTFLGVGNDPRYTPTTTFETFPFPWPPGKEDTAAPAHQAISAAARQLHEERELWLNPPDLLALGATAEGKTLRERTLTNLYNALVAYRHQNGERPAEGANGNGNGGSKLIRAARDFAPRLAQLHDTLDRAVLSAYGWDDLAGRLRTPEGDEDMLRRLLALNLERAAQSPAGSLPPTPPDDDDLAADEDGIDEETDDE